MSGVGVYAAAWASRCFRCHVAIEAGIRRPWLAVGAPLCAACTVSLGMGDVEGVVSAIDHLEGVRLPHPLDRAALARLTHAAGQHAAARLDAAASVLLAGDNDEGDSDEKGLHTLLTPGGGDPS